MAGPSEVLVPFPQGLRRVTGVRGTLLVSSQQALRQAGHFDRYRENLPPTRRDELLEVIAASWVPTDLAEAHYAACEALSLNDAQLLEVGEHVGDRIQGAFMNTLTRALRNMGVTPWSLLGQFQRLWERLMQGGGVQVSREGPKDARVEIHGLSLVQYPYFRTAFRGVFHAGFKLVGCPRYFVRVGNVRIEPPAVLYTAQWV